MKRRVTGPIGALIGLGVVVSVVTTQPTVLPAAILFALVFTGFGFVIGHFLDQLGVSALTLCLIPVLAVSCAGLLVGANAKHTRNRYLLQADGVRTEATIVESHPEDHNSIVWRYHTPLGELRAAGLAPLDRPARDLVPGDRIEVIYSSSRPEVSTAREPYETWASQWAESLWLGFFGAGWITLILAWQWRRLSRGEIRVGSRWPESGA